MNKLFFQFAIVCFSSLSLISCKVYKGGAVGSNFVTPYQSAKSVTATAKGTYILGVFGGPHDLVNQAMTKLMSDEELMSNQELRNVTVDITDTHYLIFKTTTVVVHASVPKPPTRDPMAEILDQLKQNNTSSPQTAAPDPRLGKVVKFKKGNEIKEGILKKIDGKRISIIYQPPSGMSEILIIKDFELLD